MNQIIQEACTPNLQRDLAFLESISHVNFILAGGACLDAVKNLFGLSHNSNDYDLFFENENDYQEAERILGESLENEPESESKENDINNWLDGLEAFDYGEPETTETRWARSFIIQGKKFQIIKIFKPFKTQIEEFDINNSKFWSTFPFDKVKTECTFQDLVDINVNEGPINLITLSRIHKYHEEKSLNVSPIISRIYDIFVNPELQDFTGALYFDEELDDIEQTKEQSQKYYLANLIRDYLNIPEFIDYAKTREIAEPLPFEIFSDSLLSGSQNKDLSSIKAHLMRRGLSSNYSVKDKEFIEENYPELIL